MIMAKKYNKTKKTLYAVSIYNELTDKKYHSIVFIKADHTYAAFSAALSILQIPQFCKNLAWRCVPVPDELEVD